MKSLIFSLLFFLQSSICLASIDFGQNEEFIEDEYIVILKSDFKTQSFIENLIGEIEEDSGGKVIKTFEFINGFVIKTKNPDIIRERDDIEYVEHNQNLHILNTQYVQSWGLDRIDQRQGLDDKYNYDLQGKGVDAYIVDTGIKSSHGEFAGRIFKGYSSIRDSRGTEDCNGHGSHVAGTVGGTQYGVAKRVNLVPVRVLDCNGSGSVSGIISGIEWVIRNVNKPSVVNMSLGGGYSKSLNDVVASAVKKGITFVVAAGNENEDACYGSPSSESLAITVAASDSSDNHATFSNWGRCVDVYAPGVSIRSAGIGSSYSAVLSGTSMASPHVAGLAALVLEKYPNYSPYQVIEIISDAATKNTIERIPRTTINALIYTRFNQSNDPTDPCSENECNDR